MMLWKKTQVLWSTYYVLLRTSAFSTDISHRDTPTRLPPFLLGSVSVSGGGSSGVLVQQQNLLSR